MQSLFLSHDQKDKKEYRKIIEQTTEAVCDAFDSSSAYSGPEPEELRKDIILSIDDADMNEDVEVRIWLENFLVEEILPLRKQAAEWLDATDKLTDSELNIHIADYTHYLK